MILDYSLILFLLILIVLLSYPIILRLGKWLETQINNIKQILDICSQIMSKSGVSSKEITTVVLQHMGFKSNSAKKPVYLDEHGLVIFLDSDRVNIIKMDTQLWGATFDHRIDAKFSCEMQDDVTSICNHLKKVETDWYDVTPTAGLSFDHTAADLGAEEIRVHDGKGYHYFSKAEKVHWPLPQEEDEFES